MISASLVEKFSAMTEQNISSSAEFRIQMALHKKLETDNLTHSLINPRRLDATTDGALAMAPVITISAYVSDDEVLELASSLFRAY